MLRDALEADTIILASREAEILPASAVFEDALVAVAKRVPFPHASKVVGLREIVENIRRQL